MKRFFIGIDFSKLKFDAALFDGDANRLLSSSTFENNETGFKEMMKWIKTFTRTDSKDWLFCG